MGLFGVEQFQDTDRLSIEQDTVNEMKVLLDPYTIDPATKEKSKIGLSWYAAEGFTRGLVGRQYTTRGLYSAPITADLARAVRLWNPAHVVYTPSSLEQKIANQVEVERLLLDNARLQEAWKERKEVPNYEDYGLIPHSNPDLWLKDYQIVGAALCKNPAGYGLFMDMGTGKTPVAIYVMCSEAAKRDDKPYKVIVVVPPALKLNWYHEIHKFTTVPTHVCLLKGDQTTRIINMLSAFSEAQAKKDKLVVVITTYDTVSTSIDLFTAVRWDMAIGDEIQWIKDPKSIRAKKMLELRKFADKRLALTGTPIGNSILDLYTVLEFLEPGASGFSTPGEFKANHAITKVIGTGIETVVATRFHNDLKFRIAQRAYVVKKKDVLNLPEKVFELNDVEMTPKQAKAYHQMASQLVAQFEGMDDQTRAASTNHILTQLLRLAQITSGFICLDPNEDDEDAEHVKEIHYFENNPKIARLREMCAELPRNEKMIIWNKWVPMISPICTMLKENGYKYALYRGSQENRNNMAAMFNEDRDCRFFIANKRSAGMGLNAIGYPPGKQDEYDTDTTEMVNFSYDWSFLDDAQAQDRANRIGSRKQLRIRRLVVPNSIDIEIHDTLELKRSNADEIQDIRELLRKIAIEL